MADYRKPLPVPTAESEPFWDAIKRHEFLLQKCQACGEFSHPPRSYCPNCSSDQLQWTKVSGRGSLYSWGIAHRQGHPAFRDDVPYVIGLIELDEGVRFLSNVVDCAFDQLRVGLPLEVVFEDVTPEATLPKFRPLQA